MMIFAVSAGILFYDTPASGKVSHMKICIRCGNCYLILIALFALIIFGNAHSTEMPLDSRQSVIDVRDAESEFIVQKGDFVIVPIPMSDPTLGTGLVLGGAYFYAQTEKQKESQPASLTGVAGIYTNNDSYAFGIGQQNYWDEDKWRFNGLLAHADFKFALLDPAKSSDTIDWVIEGDIVQAEISRKILGDWYFGVQARYVNVIQIFDINLEEIIDFDVKSEMTSVGTGATLMLDTRDVPTNAYTGMYFKVNALFNREISGSDDRYQTYEASLKSYHQLAEPVVVAWEVRGCTKSGAVPLWDSCLVGLRGFAATDYLGTSSVSGQVEARWRVWKKLGVVGFAGYGASNSTYSKAGGDVSIPSYGFGFRFMVLESRRINMRLDFARSDDSDAVYLSVAEAF